jgi:hypothetical protein
MCCPYWQLCRVRFHHFGQVDGVGEARQAFIESRHTIVNLKLSACGGGTFSRLEGTMRFGGKMHIKFGGKMHIKFGGKMH